MVVVVVVVVVVGGGVVVLLLLVVPRSRPRGRASRDGYLHVKPWCLRRTDSPASMPACLPLCLPACLSAPYRGRDPTRRIFASTAFIIGNKQAVGRQ